MLKYIQVLSLLLGSSIGQICPPAEIIFPCQCHESEKTIDCIGIQDPYDIKAHFDNISSFVDEDAIFDELTISDVSGLSEIPSGSIKSLKFLSITISSNENLKSVASDAFEASISVTKSLMIWDNIGWPSGERDIFDFVNGFKVIETVTIFASPIQAIPDNAFGSLPNLLDLDLGINDISTIGGSAFAQLPSLTKVTLRNNALTIDGISPDAFKGIGSQVNVDLSDNRLIEYLPEAVFKPILEEALTLEVGGGGCSSAGCTYLYLYCDERADWLCAKQAEYEPKLEGFRCKELILDVWYYCANKMKNSSETIKTV